MVAVLAIVGLQHWNTTTYAITPGDATPVGPLVKISGVGSTSHHDKILFTDVYLQQLTAWQWLTFHLQSHVEYLNQSELLDPGVPVSELNAQGFLEMSDSKQAAEVAAFNALGWKTFMTPAGAVVTGVTYPSPAERVNLFVGDRITGINGQRVTGACDLVNAVYKMAPGTKAALRIDKAHYSATGVLTYTSTVTKTVVTEKTPKGIGTSGCPGDPGISRSWLGVSLEDGTTYQLPGTVSINTANIGGPSAGLAMTLSIIDKLSKDSLAGGAPIAATGTMDIYGNVGDVGGVAEKTVAVQRAGAKYFIVPQVEVKTAQANAAPGLKIIGVTTLGQALNDLRAIDGGVIRPITKPH